MKWLLNKSVLSVIQHRLEAGSRLLLYINFDDTLGAAVAGGVSPLDPENRVRLRELSEMNALTLIVVSDRSLSSVKKLVGFSGIYFIANNGLEIFGPDLNVVHAEAKRAKQAVHTMAQTLLKKLNGGLQGISVDDRGLSLAVNLAKAKPQQQKQARQCVEELWMPAMERYTLLEKNHELTLKPRVGWSKSRAVMFLWNKFASPRRRPLVIYIGADESEEEIYNYMGREGMGVVVGGASRIAQTKAGYYLKNRLEVGRFITWLSRNLSHLPSHTTTV